MAASKLARAPRAVMPEFIEPQLATPTDHAPAGAAWLHEIKFDGYRAQLRVHAGHVTVRTRRGQDWTVRFPKIAAAARRLPDSILDGEAVVLDAEGQSDFSALQSALASGRDDRVIFMAFDLLYERGEDLRALPLEARTERLQRLLARARPALGRIRYVEHIMDNGPAVERRGCEMGLEGIVSKRAGAPYRAGIRNDDWRKVKCGERDSFVIGGWRERAGLVSSLMLGEWRDNELRYVGKARVGGKGQYVRSRLKALETDVTPFAAGARPAREERQHWVRPVLSAEVAFTAWTRSRHLRLGIFKGLREDIAPPAPVAVPRARTGHVQRLLADAVSPDAALLQAYWKRVGKRALTYLARRPLTLVRHARGQTFYHTGSLPDVPAAVHRIEFEKREGGEGIRLWVDSVAGLVALPEIGVVEVHPWNATVDDIEHPDRIAFDLDPGAGISWPFVIATALALRDFLKQEAKLSSWPKATGGKGLHVMVPLDGSRTHDQARMYARALATRFAARDPRYTVASSVAKRGGRIFIDYLRNGRAQTAVGAYSPRARPGFPVAMPLTWKQIESGVRADAFTIANVLGNKR